MKAAVTEAPGAMRVADVPDVGDPGSGEVLVRPEAVGLCGSDFHYFLGHLGDAVGTDLYPRIQGHEFALDETPAAIEYAIRHPAEVMKAMIRLEGT